MTITWKKVTKDEALDFMSKYPTKLVSNFYMDSYTCHDFTKHKGFASVVVMADLSYATDELENWRINVNFLENTLSVGEIAHD